MTELIAYIFWFVLLNGSAIALLAYAFMRLEAGAIKKTYLSFLLTSLSWTNLIFFVRGPLVTEAGAAIASKWIFATLILSLVSLAVFLFHFSGQTEEFRHPRFLIFLGSNVFFLGASFLGGVENGVRQTEYGFAPKYGPLHPFYVASNFLWGGYMFYIMYRTYRRTTSEALRFQMEILAKNALAMFIFVGVFNGIIPALTGNSKFSHVGPVGMVFFYWGVLHIILNEKSLFLRKLFHRFTDRAPMRDRANLSAVRQLLQMLESILDERMPQFRRELIFAKGTGEPLPVVVSGGDPHTRLPPGRAKALPGWVIGLVDSIRRLEMDNRRLAFAMISAQGHGRESMVGDVGTLSPAFPPGSFLFENYEEEINENLRANEDVFGLPFLCFSTGLKKVLNRMERIAASDAPVVFVGESGVGKTLLARALHGYRKGGQLVELSGADPGADVAGRAKKALSSRSSGRRPGILIRHLRAGDKPLMRTIQWLEQENRGSAFFYVTCTENPFSEAQDFVSHMTIAIPPLRDRSADVFHQFLHYCGAYAVRNNLRYAGIREDAVDGLNAEAWPGNSSQLITLAEEQVLTGQPPLITLPGAARRLAHVEARGKSLTPLEEAEMKTIVHCFAQNHHIKRRTAHALGITINTLKAKMEKYGIHV